MQKEEIIAGIKQAIERGYSLEQAKASFINAGYSLQDVEDSAKSFLGVSSYMPQSLSPLPPTQTQRSQPLQYKQTTSQNLILPAQPIQINITSSKPKGTAMLIFIIMLAIILLALLGFLTATVFYKEQVQEFLEPVFPSWFSAEI